MSRRRWALPLAMLAAWPASTLAREEATQHKSEVLDLDALRRYIDHSGLKFELHVERNQTIKVEPEARCDRRSMDLRVIQVADGSRSIVASNLEPAQQAILEAAEQHFEANRPAQALELYTKLLEQNRSDPRLWVLYGDAQFQQKDYKSALDAYRHAIELDPTHLYAHAFAADALGHLGRLAEARVHWLTALSLDPTYDQVTNALVPKLATELGVSLERIPIEPPDAIGERRENVIPLSLSGEQVKSWMMYAFCKALWRHDDSFRQARGHTGSRSAGTISSQEESECLRVMLLSRLSQLPGDDLKQLDPMSARMLEAGKSGVWDGMVLWEVLGRRCPISLSLLDEDVRNTIKQYLEKMVIKPLK